MSQSPLAVFNSLSGDRKPESLRKAHKFWVEHETRRRVLQATFILDTQQSIMFEQPSVLLQSCVGLAKPGLRKSEMTDLPFPCPSDMWECWQIEEWYDRAKACEPLTLSSAAERAGSDATLNFDSFQSSLILSHIVTTQMHSLDLEDTLDRFNRNTSNGGSVGHFVRPLQPPRFPPPNCTVFMSHALLAAKYTPLKALLTVSGESWLFNRKIPQESEFRAAKEKVRAWVSDTEDVRKAVWHAVRVLRYAVAVSDRPANGIGKKPTSRHPAHGLQSCGEEFRSRTDQIHVLDPFGHARTQGENQAANAGRHASDASGGGCMGAPGVLPPTGQPGPLTMLQANWALYISALICWAYSFDSPITTAARPPCPPSMISPQCYISTLTSLAPSWSQLSRTTIPAHIRRDTSLLLEHIRKTRLEAGLMGGLLNEGERVLARLVEPRNGTRGRERRMWEF